MPLIERDITLTCVSNEVGGPYVGGTRWTGVRLTDLLDRAGIGSTGADQILSTDVDGMTISTPLDLATDGRDAMIAIAMDGQPLPRDHGYPARMVVPGLYGYVSACKWITRMTLTTYDEKTAYWTDRGWATDAPIKLMSRIDTPKPLANVKAGKTFIGGVAWHQHRGLTGRAGAHRRRRVAGRPARRRRAATTTGASGTSTGTPSAGLSTRSPSAPSTRRRAAVGRPRDRLPRRRQRRPVDRRQRRLSPVWSGGTGPIRPNARTEPPAHIGPHASPTPLHQPKGTP